VVVTAASTAEYDAFGPWILPVSSYDQVPPVFRSHPIDFTRAHDVLKVPREVARRDATPRSHLYDALLVLDGEGLEVLTRVGHRYTVERIARDSIAAVDSGAELLAGWLSVLATDGRRIDVAFNGGSLPVITDLADRLLGWSATDLEPAARDVLDLTALGFHDVGLVNGYNSVPDPQHRRRVVAAYAERTPVSRRSSLHRLLDGRSRLSGAVFGSDERYAVVTTRSEWVRSTRKPDLSLRRIVIPKHQVTSVAVTEHAFLDDVAELTIRCHATRLVLAVPGDEAESVADAIHPARAHDRPGRADRGACPPSDR
jgi:hypothetical protein